MSESRQVEVVVVGAGPAGIVAASRLGQAGKEVLLVDEGARPGGQVWRQGGAAAPAPEAKRWFGCLQRAGIDHLHGYSVVDAMPNGTLRAESADGSLSLRADKVILATGARERFLPFPGWTLPGVIGVGAAQALVKSGLRVENEQVVLAGSGPLLLPVAALLHREGARIALIAEQAPGAAVRRFAQGLWRLPSKLRQALGYRLRTLAVSYRFGVWAVAAHGEERLEAVELTDGRRKWTRRCSLLGCSYGLVPNVELARWLGCEIGSGRVRVNGLQQTSREGVYCVGEATGIGGADLAIAEAEVAAAHLCGQAARLTSLQRRRDRLQLFADRLERTFTLRAELRDLVEPETIICRCEDVSCQQLNPAWNTRQAKLYTRLGMGPCQGRVCGPAASFLWGWEADTVRPPLKPCRISSLSRAVAEPGVRA